MRKPTPAALAEARRQIASAGGKARAASMTAEERSARASHAARSQTREGRQAAALKRWEAFRVKALPSS